MPAKPASNPLQSLTKKAGPLPVWAWAAVAAVFVYVYRHRTANVAAPASSSSPTITPAGATDSSAAPPDLTSQLSGLGASLSDIASNQSVLQGYDETLLAGQQAIWDSYGTQTLPTVATHVGGTINSSGVYNSFPSTATTVFTLPGAGGFTGPNPSPSGYSPPDAIVGNAGYGGQYSGTIRGDSRAKLA